MGGMQSTGTGVFAYGVPGGPIPDFASTRHLFAWTTGTISITRTGVRHGNTATETMTAMGYDTTRALLTGLALVLTAARARALHGRRA